jgi:hypothetical protein
MGVDRILLFYDRDKPQAVVNKLMNLQFLYIASNFWTSMVSISFSGTMLHSLSYLTLCHP